MLLHLKDTHLCSLCLQVAHNTCTDAQYQTLFELSKSPGGCHACLLAKGLMELGFMPKTSAYGYGTLFWQGVIVNFIQNNGQIVLPITPIALTDEIDIPGFLVDVLPKSAKKQKPVEKKCDNLRFAAYSIIKQKGLPTALLSVNSKKHLGFHIAKYMGYKVKLKQGVIFLQNFVDSNGNPTDFVKRKSKGSIKISPVQPKTTYKPRTYSSGYSREAAEQLYASEEWRKLRYAVLREQQCCQLCGRSRKDGVVLHVDHIVPLSIDWSKRLDIKNLQVLCADCNLGKSNTDTIDWR